MRKVCENSSERRDPACCCEAEENSYKGGDFGRLLLIGELTPMEELLLWQALAAVHSGAGLVTVATDPDNLTALQLSS